MNFNTAVMRNNMGPFSEQTQQQRSRACARIIENPRTKPEVAQMWRRIQNRLAVTEAEYEQRVYLTYRNHKECME